MASSGKILICGTCGHDELDHGVLSDEKPYSWGCSLCPCKMLRAVETNDE